MKQLYISLHTELPSSQFENQAQYKGYHRIKALENTFFVYKDYAFNTKEILFPISNGGENTLYITHVAIGDERGRIIWANKLTNPISVNSSLGLQPKFSKKALKVSFI